MKKILIMMSLILTSIAFTLKISAYSPNTEDVQVTSTNYGMTIVSNTNPSAYWYVFQVQYNVPVSAHYILFGANNTPNLFITQSSNISPYVFLMNDSNEHSDNKSNWYMYLGNQTTGLKNLYVWVFSGGGGLAAQTLLQGLIDNSWYLYRNTTTTNRETTTNAFITRYYSLDNSESYSQGYSDGVSSGYQEGLNNGYQSAMEDYGYYDEPNDIYREWQWVYNWGYNDREDLDLNVIPASIGAGLQSILNINFAGITIGGLVMIPLMFSIFLWFIKFTKGGGK